MAKMELKTGDLVRNRITEEEGYIVRIVDHSPNPKAAAYVVSLTARVMTVANNIHLTIQQAREVLWCESDVRPVK